MDLMLNKASIKDYVHFALPCAIVKWPASFGALVSQIIKVLNIALFTLSSSNASHSP